MKYIVFLYVLLLFLPDGVAAQLPSLEGYMVSKPSTVLFTYSRSSNKGKNNAEVPPWIIPGGLRSYFFVDGSDTYIWSSGNSLVHDKAINLDRAVGPSLASMSYMHSPDFDHNKPVKNWKRNYHAIYSAEYFQHPAEGTVSIGFLHGENKNQVTGNVNSSSATHYQNTIQQNVPINLADHQSYSGGSPFRDGWNAYNAMISAAWTHNNAQTNWGQQFFQHELGPIAWPSTGYITRNGVKCTSGLKHPSSIIAGGYVYIFYADGGPFGNNIPQEEGRQEGIKVVRAPLANALSADAYEVYYRDSVGNENWLPSLPAGFTKESMLQYVAVQGPRSTDIINDRQHSAQEIRFSVAKVRQGDYFMGVEEYIDVADGKKFKVALRFSQDLVNWTDRQLVVYEAPNWEKTQLNYPVFLDKEGWTNTEIDIDDFYILGTGTTPQMYVNRVHVFKPNPSTEVTAFSATPARSPAGDYAWPNPTNGIFQVSYQLEEPARVRISLLDITGRRMGMIRNETKNQGSHTASLDMQTYPAGLYFVEVLVNNRRRIVQVMKK